MPEIILSPESMWQAALGELQLQLSKAAFDNQFHDSILVSHDSETNKFVIGVSNDDIKRWLEQRMLSTLRRTLTGISRRPANIQLEVVNNDFGLPLEKPVIQDSDVRILAEWGMLGVPPRYETETLETLDWAQGALQKTELRNYVEQSLAHFKDGVGLTLMGPTGSGYRCSSEARCSQM